MDILYFLKSEFEEFKSLIQAADLKVKASQLTASQETAHRDARSSLGLALRLYMILNRDYIYPEIRGLSPNIDLLINQGQMRLQEIESLFGGAFLGQGEAIHNLDEKTFHRLLLALKEHINLEEQLLMPKIRLQMRTEDREDLGQVLVDVKDEILAASAHKRLDLKKPDATVTAHE